MSRAKFQVIDRLTTRHVVGVLCEFLRAHLDAVDEAVRELGTTAITSDGGSGAVGRAQNTVTQAVFLVLLQMEGRCGSPGRRAYIDTCKRKHDWEELVVRASVLQRVVTSVLNPLKVRFLFRTA